MVYIVGAGPGDPELITVKGQKILRTADVVIYAGSLVNPELLQLCRPDVEVHNSAQMTLDEVIRVIEKAEKSGKMTVRLHTGDPAIYGAIREQMDEFEKRGIDFEIIPGVSSFLAAAAALKAEYTLPGISQTVILTRQGGRTPVPDRESLKNLARHKSTMCIFLSVNLIDKVVSDLIQGGFSKDTPVAVVYRASQPNEKILRGTLETISESVSENKIDRTALIIVGYCLDCESEVYEKSKLYSPTFSHGFRKAKL